LGPEQSNLYKNKKKLEFCIFSENFREISYPAAARGPRHAWRFQRMVAHGPRCGHFEAAGWRPIGPRC
jgi:hypothetical protein